MRELWSVVLQTSATRMLSLLAGLAILFVTARWIGADGRGTVAAVTTWASLFAVLGSLSLGQVATHRLAVEGDEGRLHVLTGNLLAVLGSVTLAGWVLVGAAVLMRGVPAADLQAAVLALGFALLPFLILEQYASSLLAAISELRVYNRYQLLGRGLALALTLAFAGWLDAGVTGVLAAVLIGQALVSCGALAFLLARIRSAGRSIRVDAGELGRLLAGGAKLHLNAIGTFLFSSADVLILHYYRGPAETGQYQLAAQLVGALMVVPQAASMALFGSVAAKGPDGAWRENLQLLKHTLVLMIAVGVVAGLSAPWWMVRLAGEDFTRSVSLFQWLLLSLPGMTFSTLLAPQWIGRGLFMQASALTIAVGIVNVCANFYLIPFYGSMGAVLSNVGTFAFSLAGNGAMAIYCWRRTRGSDSAP